jgi:protease-4
MPERQRGWFVRLFGGLWALVNFLRRLVLNAIFVAVLIAIAVTWFAARPQIAPRTTLVLAPQGAIVEQYTTDPTERALAGIAGDETGEVQLRDLLRAIDTAATDARIDRIVLVPDDIRSAGFATSREIGQALDRFRAKGKKVVALSAGMDQGPYLLAAHADRILLDPDGGVLLQGLSNYRAYYREALDKLGVQVHLIKVGTFKSAAEPFVLDQASAAAKEADGYWLGGLWQGYLAEVAKLRKLDAAALQRDIDHADQLVAERGGDLARLALEQKLVDEIATRPEARAQLRATGVPDATSDGFRQIDWRSYLATIDRETMPNLGPAVAVVVAQGEIVPGERPQGMVGGTSTAQLIRHAREDSSIKAVVLRVDSPGGDAEASEVIRREIAQTRESGKPVIVSMGDVAASGGYWISMNGDAILAAPDTITGSIGIFALIPTIPETLARLGVHVDGVATSPIAGGLDIRRPLSPQVESILTSIIQRGYRQFVGKVATARQRTPEQIDAIAQGRVWTGAQALERGLVDRLGGLHDAIAEAARRANLGTGYRVRYVEPEPSLWQRLALTIGNSDAAVRLARAAGFRLPAGLVGRDELRQLAAVADSLRGRRYGMFARCLCDVRP